MAGGNGVSTHVTHSASLFLSFLGAGGCLWGKREPVCVLVAGYRPLCACPLLYNYLCEELLGLYDDHPLFCVTRAVLES